LTINRKSARPGAGAIRLFGRACRGFGAGIGRAAAALSLLLAVLCSAGLAQAQPDNRPMLIFSVNQGFANGPVENGDVEAVGRMADSLKLFSGRYRVYALLSVWHSNVGSISRTLDVLKARNIPFLVDVYSSDALTIPPLGAGLADLSHGIPLSMSDLEQLRQKYGPLFAGVRSHEVFAEDYTIDACRQQHEHWCDAFKAKLPSDQFFQPAKLEGFISFAGRNNMFVLFSEPFWSFHHQDPAQPARERVLAGLLHKYPGRVIVTYANNEPNGDSAQVINQWAQGLRPFVVDGAAGIGLSDQAWICAPPVLNCPVGKLTDWAKSALAARVRALETEPYWYWWDLPPGRGANNYPQYKAAQAKGQPRANLACFAQALSVPPAGLPQPCPR
jgi:hypothetical protein